MRFSKMTKGLTLSLALAASALVTPQLATPAHAGAVVTRFNEGDIIKLKTFWEEATPSTSAGPPGRTAPARVPEFTGTPAGTTSTGSASVRRNMTPTAGRGTC